MINEHNFTRFSLDGTILSCYAFMLYIHVVYSPGSVNKC